MDYPGHGLDYQWPGLGLHVGRSLLLGSAAHILDRPWPRCRCLRSGLTCPACGLCWTCASLPVVSAAFHLVWAYSGLGYQWSGLGCPWASLAWPWIGLDILSLQWVLLPVSSDAPGLGFPWSRLPVACPVRGLCRQWPVPTVAWHGRPGETTCMTWEVGPRAWEVRPQAVASWAKGWLDHGRAGPGDG